MKLFCALMVLVSVNVALDRANADSRAANCGEALQAKCKDIHFSGLPPAVKALMKKQKCNVKSGSNYDYGSAVDLNDDGLDEYIFCCSEAPHGPCGAKIYAKSGGTWRPIEGVKTLLGIDSSCAGISILKEKTNGFHDLCLPNQVPALRKYDNGEYEPIN
jgi:hypothetical protein